MEVKIKKYIEKSFGNDCIKKLEIISNHPDRDNVYKVDLKNNGEVKVRFCNFKDEIPGIRRAKLIETICKKFSKYIPTLYERKENIISMKWENGNWKDIFTKKNIYKVGEVMGNINQSGLYQPSLDKFHEKLGFFMKHFPENIQINLNTHYKNNIIVNDLYGYYDITDSNFSNFLMNNGRVLLVDEEAIYPNELKGTGLPKVLERLYENNLKDLIGPFLKGYTSHVNLKKEHLIEVYIYYFLRHPDKSEKHVKILNVLLKGENGDEERRQLLPGYDCAMNIII